MQALSRFYWPSGNEDRLQLIFANYENLPYVSIAIEFYLPTSHYGHHELHKKVNVYTRITKRCTHFLRKLDLKVNN